MNQLTLFEDEVKQKPVNVASVPMRSPFRYPGGKTWLIPWIRKWLRTVSCDTTLIEPFTGGGIVSLTAIFENLVQKVLMVEKDEDVAAVWETILGRHGEWLARQICSFEVTSENVEAVMKNSRSTRQKAFVTILRNRLNRGGILAKGAGRIKYGENGKGMLSRWYPTTLKNRILSIREFREKIKFVKADGITIIKENSRKKKTAFFIDPPYTIAGRRLYKYSEIDHEQLFNVTAKIAGDFLMTYDEADEITQLAEDHGFAVERVLMKTTHHTEKYELLIGRKLDWL